MATSLATPQQTFGSVFADNKKIPVRLPGLRRAAILVTSVGEEACAAILRNLREDEVHDIMREITHLDDITDQQRESVLKEFGDAMNDPLRFTGGFEYVQKILVAAFGPESGLQMAARLSKHTANAQPDLSAIQKADPQRIARLMQQEHPQAIALVLSQITPAQASQLLAALPAEIRTPVARRFATLDRISPEVINRIAKSLGSKLKTAGDRDDESCGGVRALAEVLNRADSELSEKVLGGIASDDPNLAESIRNLMFVFDDLLKIPSESMRELLRRVDRKLLPLSLKGSGPQIRAHFAKFMSSRAAEMLNEDMQALGPVRLREVESAQQQIIAVARQLQNEGLISLKPEAADRLVE